MSDAGAQLTGPGARAGGAKRRGLGRRAGGRGRLRRGQCVGRAEDPGSAAAGRLPGRITGHGRRRHPPALVLSLSCSCSWPTRRTSSLRSAAHGLIAIVLAGTLIAGRPPRAVRLASRAARDRRARLAYVGFGLGQ